MLSHSLLPPSLDALSPSLVTPIALYGTAGQLLLNDMRFNFNEKSGAEGTADQWESAKEKKVRLFQISMV